MKIGLVCSSGGHLSDLYKLNSIWSTEKRFWVTFNKTDANALLKGEQIYHCYFPTNRNIMNAVRNTFLAIRILKDEKPDILISGGAGVAVPFYYVGKLMGIKLVFIEAFDRFQNPTLTGRLVYPITDCFIVQWEQMKKYYPKAKCFGSLY